MGAAARGSREIYSAYWYVFYTSFASNTDLLLASPVADPSAGLPCRRIVPFTSGNIVVVRPDGTTVTITGVVAGQVLDIQAKQITAAGTTVTSALVHW